MTDLLPCPFCGGSDLSVIHHDIDGWMAYIKCDSCDGEVHGPNSEYKYDDKDEASADAAACWNRRPSLPTSQVHAYPQELTDELRDVLSLMMWNTGPIAHALRFGGSAIPPKAELEQAHVLHWLTLLVLTHRRSWREKAQDRINEIRDGATPEVQP